MDIILKIFAGLGAILVASALAGWLIAAVLPLLDDDIDLKDL